MKCSIFIFFALFWGEIMGQHKTIIPEPLQTELHSKKLAVNQLWNCTQFETGENDSLLHLVDIFKSYQKSRNNYIPTPSDFKIIWKKNTAFKSEEGYRLTITPRNATIEYLAYGGAFNGCMTLTQTMLLHQNDNNIATQTITDAPKYSFRALMVDPARHFLTIDELKLFVKTMSLYKYNTLHLHLSDDQGWRIEIKSHPEITEKGSLVNGKRLYYTQEEIKDLIQYAKQYHIEIMPEIDIPGHATGLLVTYPELACEPKKLHLWTAAGVSEDILCAGNEKTYKILEDIFKELANLFSYKNFHLGGDEAPLKRWTSCEKCNSKMKSLGLNTVQDLFSYFLVRNGKIFQKFHKTTLFWYELDIPEYPKNAICYYWRYGKSKEVIEKLGQQNIPMISSSGEYSYFDYPQSTNDIPNADWMPVCTFENVTKFDPTWKTPTELNKNILGVEATLWGEFLQNIHEVHRMTYPRAFAYAEAGWSQQKNRKSYQEFKNILLQHLYYLTTLGINYRPPFDLY